MKIANLELLNKCQGCKYDDYDEWMKFTAYDVCLRCDINGSEKVLITNK